MENKMKSSSVEKNSRLDKSNDGSTKKSQETEKNREKKLTITLGVCAMKKKVHSKPMKQILSRLKCPEIEITEMWQFLDDHWSVDHVLCSSGPSLTHSFVFTLMVSLSLWHVSTCKNTNLFWSTVLKNSNYSGIELLFTISSKRLKCPWLNTIISSVIKIMSMTSN